LRQEALAVGLIFLLICSSVLSITAHDATKPSQPSTGDGWLYVGGSGPGNYTRIQDAIDASHDGDSIFVYAASSPYYECLVMNTSMNIHLIGEDRNTTVIDGQQGSSDIITVLKSGTCISGFSIVNNSFNNPCLIMKYASDCTLENNNFRTLHGDAVQILHSNTINVHENSIDMSSADGPVDSISLFNSSLCSVVHNRIRNDRQTANNTVQGIIAEDCEKIDILLNTISFVRNGIVFSGDTIQIEQNTISDTLVGIATKVPKDSPLVIKNITITNNRLQRNANSNIYLSGVVHCVITGNQIENSTGYGIYLDENFFTYPEEITIRQNNLRSNRVAIEAASSSSVLIEYNEMRNNDVGLSIDYGAYAYVRNNTFLENNKTASFRWFWFFSSLKETRAKIPRFDKNFWDKSRSSPVPIFGRWHLLTPFFPHVNFLVWVTFDWHPAQEPYDIPRIAI
jgi:parallel beta-helix repeat protein